MESQKKHFPEITVTEIPRAKHFCHFNTAQRAFILDSLVSKLVISSAYKDCSGHS